MQLLLFWNAGEGLVTAFTFIQTFDCRAQTERDVIKLMADAVE